MHRPGDARIAHRQLSALRAAGWEVTYAAAFGDSDVAPPAGVTAIDLPRARGRDRLRSLRAARRLLHTEGPAHDVVLLHDPELLLALPGTPLDNVVWDVHEDTAAALGDRDWIPRWAVPPLRVAARWLERWAERRCAGLLLAEHSYAARFAGVHPVVPNVPRVPTDVPPCGTDRVVYVGRLSTSRGAHELVALARELAGEVTVELIGYADRDVAQLLSDADAEGTVRWHGYLPNDQALERVQGAAFGLSLLHDEPNFRGSLPTKVAEYLANGVPPLTTPLPEAVRLVERAGVGEVVPFGDVAATAAAVRAGVADPEAHRAAGRAAHGAALRLTNWDVEGPRFVAALAAAAHRAA